MDRTACTTLHNTCIRRQEEEIREFLDATYGLGLPQERYARMKYQSWPLEASEVLSWPV